MSTNHNTTNRWIEIRDPQTNRLLFRYNPAFSLIEIKCNGMQRPLTVDLKQYAGAQPAP